jgi:hypothetical protein
MGHYQAAQAAPVAGAIRDLLSQLGVYANVINKDFQRGHVNPDRLGGLVLVVA